MKRSLIIAIGLIVIVLVIAVLATFFLTPSGPELSADFKSFVYDEATKKLEITITNTGELRIDMLTLGFQSVGKSLLMKSYKVEGQVIQVGETQVIHVAAGRDYSAGIYEFVYELISLKGEAETSDAMEINIKVK